MPKGGARTASDKFVVSKAMGFEYFYEVLKFLKDNDNKFFEINEILNSLNKKFAYWDPSRNETCRGTLKELWRVNFIDQYSKKIIQKILSMKKIGMENIFYIKFLKMVKM